MNWGSFHCSVLHSLFVITGTSQNKHGPCCRGLWPWHCHVRYKRWRDLHSPWHSPFSWNVNSIRPNSPRVFNLTVCPEICVAHISPDVTGSGGSRRGEPLQSVSTSSADQMPLTLTVYGSKTLATLLSLSGLSDTLYTSAIAIAEPFPTHTSAHSSMRVSLMSCSPATGPCLSSVIK